MFSTLIIIVFKAHVLPVTNKTTGIAKIIDMTLHIPLKKIFSFLPYHLVVKRNFCRWKGLVIAFLAFVKKQLRIGSKMGVTFNIKPIFEDGK